MSDEITHDIELREIDTDDLENIDANREAVQFRVRLSGHTSDAWRQEFDQAYLQTPYTLKPPVFVEDEALRIEYLPRYAGELSGFFHFLAMIVRRANQEAHQTEEMHTSNVQERRKEEFRKALRRIELPK